MKPIRIRRRRIIKSFMLFNKYSYKKCYNSSTKSKGLEQTTEFKIKQLKRALCI